jgi:hypothetical protein
MMPAKEVSRRLTKYAAQYKAGTFAAPQAAEIGAHNLREWPGFIAINRRSGRSSYRRDFTRRRYQLPPEANILTHVAREPSAPVPDLSEYSHVFAYAEDQELTAALLGQGKQPLATKVTPASGIVTCFHNGSAYEYEARDQATLARMQDIDPPVGTLAAEASAATGWDDDFPYYNAGAWLGLSLRGYRPDPAWGIKPSEMPRKWQRGHPEAMTYPCDWTDLTARFPGTVEWIKSVPWWGEFDRIRLMRLQGGGLDRHIDSDTDNSHGTNIGQLVRFHIPLVTTPAATGTVWRFDGSSSTSHLPAGGVFYLDARKPHSVTNPSDEERIHLAVDVVVTGEVQDRLAGGVELR